VITPRSLWRSWRLPWAGRKLRVVEVVDAADEIPDRLPRNGAILVGSLNHPTWVAFECPCVDHHRVMLNLDVRRRPTWAMQSAKPLTLRPSIDESRGAKRCHYFVRNGKVEWVPLNRELGGR
jgi:hypothetical protein